MVENPFIDYLFQWSLLAAFSLQTAESFSVSTSRSGIGMRWPQQTDKPSCACSSRLGTSLSGDDEARSSFGTKEYWDEVYTGFGDFPADEYSWYFGFEGYQKFVRDHVSDKEAKILIPGIGNDTILLDLLEKGYRHLTATDYSEHAIERQVDLLSYQHSDSGVALQQMDARQMNPDWTNRFDAILEKGALDAIYLSGDGNFELTVKEFERVLKPGGCLISVSGVVPEDLRKETFEYWEWIRDGTDDLKAGCFVLKNKSSQES